MYLCSFPTENLPIQLLVISQLDICKYVYYGMYRFAYSRFGYICAVDLPVLGLRLSAYNTATDGNKWIVGVCSYDKKKNVFHVDQCNNNF